LPCALLALDTTDAQTLRSTGFKISLNAPGLEAVGVEFPPGVHWNSCAKHAHVFAVRRLLKRPGVRCLARRCDHSADHCGVSADGEDD